MRHSDHGVRYTGIVYTTRVMEYGMLPSTGTVGDSYGNAMAESVNGAYRTELVWRRKPFQDLRGLELATSRWVSWRDSKRLHRSWATGHRRRWKPSTIQTKRHKPLHYKSGTKIRPLQIHAQAFLGVIGQNVCPAV